MFQQLLANKHHRLRDSRLSLVRPCGGLRLANKPRVHVDYEPRSAHGRAVKKSVAPGGITLQSKHNLNSHVAKVIAAMSENSVADFIPFLAYLLFPLNPTRIKTDKT